MLQQVVRITDVVQKLKDYGHTHYLSWSTVISCSQYCTEDEFVELVKLADLLENELACSINYVWRCRQRFYHLNFYTNQQLLLLREKLKTLQDDIKAVADSQLFHLLQSITGHLITSTFLIRKVLKGEAIDSLEYVDDIDESKMSDDEEVLLHKSQGSNVSIEIPTDSSPLEKAIQELSTEEHGVFTELTEQMEYDKVLSLEAVKQADECDIYSTMEWCEDHSSDTEFLKGLNQKWQIDVSNVGKSMRDLCDTVPLQLEGQYDLSSEAEFIEIGSFFYPFMNSERNMQSKVSVKINVFPAVVRYHLLILKHSLGMQM